MNSQDNDNIEKEMNEVEKNLQLFTFIREKLNLKPGSYFGFYDTRGFAVLNIFNKITNTNRTLKVSKNAQVLIDTKEYYSVHQYHTKKDMLFFSKFIEEKDGLTITKHGILDENFKVLLPALYDSLQGKTNESYEASINNYCGILNSKFEIIIPLKYREIDYNKNLQVYKAREQINEEGQSIYHIFNQKGTFLKTLHYGLVNFTSRFSCYNIYDTQMPYDAYIEDYDMIGGQGLLDQNFTTLVPPIYDLIFQGKTSIIVYEQRDAVTAHDYESEEAQCAEVYYTLDGGKYGVFDYQKNLIIPFSYNWIEHTSHEEFLLINPDGLLYFYQGEQEDGCWYVQQGHWGLINTKNEIIVKPVYKFINRYENKIIFYNMQATDGSILDLENAMTFQF